MLDTKGHEMAKANGGSRESKQETIREHQEKIIAGHGNNTTEQQKKD